MTTEAAQAESVNPEGTPAPAEASQAPEQGETQAAETQNGNEEVLPFGKHPRWQKMVQERQQLRSELQQIRQAQKEHEGPISLGNFLRANPQVARKVFELINGQQQQGDNGGDPFAEYEPDVAERLRTVDELKQWKAQQEAERQAREEQSTQTVQEEIDTDFDSRLVKDGFLNQDGSPKNEKTVEVISLGVKSFLENNCKDPNRPTKAEFNAAYSTIMEVYSHLRDEASKSALQGAVQGHIPATGTGKGQPPAGKTSRNSHDRIMDIAGSI